MSITQVLTKQFHLNPKLNHFVKTKIILIDTILKELDINRNSFKSERRNGPAPAYRL